MDPALLQLAREALVAASLASAPPLAAALAVGLLTGVLQAATTVQEPSLAVVPRLAAVLGALLVAAPWIAAQVVRFAVACLEAAAWRWP
ncbi:MAG: flagellar biosynthetic protein FliQ [Anaeromyxobacter sp.]